MTKPVVLRPLEAVQTSIDGAIPRFREKIDALYGDKIERVVLFGSRARGDARAGSDYDVAIFLASPFEYWREGERLADLRIDMLDEMGSFLDTKIFPAGSLDDRTPIMHEIRKDGRPL